jgi:hypothetical protein
MQIQVVLYKIYCTSEGEFQKEIELYSKPMFLYEKHVDRQIYGFQIYISLDQIFFPLCR